MNRKWSEISAFSGETKAGGGGVQGDGLSFIFFSDNVPVQYLNNHTKFKTEPRAHVIKLLIYMHKTVSKDDQKLTKYQV